MTKGVKSSHRSEAAKGRWKSYTDDEYWKVVDSIKASSKRYWDSLTPEQRKERIDKMSAARAAGKAKRAAERASA